MEPSTAKLPVMALRDFTLRMAQHGFPVSSTLMLYEPSYALDQLRCAHTLADADLRVLAMHLFRHLEPHARVLEPLTPGAPLAAAAPA